MTQTYSFFDRALQNAIILTTGEPLDMTAAQDYVRGLYRDCYREGSITGDGFTIRRNISENYSTYYTVEYTA